jgi:hypothetical protein
MTPATRNGVSAPARATAGGEVTVFVGMAYAGQTVDVWLHSTPVHLGRVEVRADGRVRVALPADAPAGAHRVAVVAADGTLIGWDALQVVAARSAAGQLAVTGSEGSPLAASGAALVAAGALLVLARGVRRRAAGSDAAGPGDAGV